MKSNTLHIQFIFKASKPTKNRGQKIWSCADDGNLIGLMSALAGATEQDINWKSLSSVGGRVVRTRIFLVAHCLLLFSFLINWLALFRSDFQMGDTALIRASTKGHTEIVQLLVDVKAAINAKGWVSVWGFCAE